MAILSQRSQPGAGRREGGSSHTLQGRQKHSGPCRRGVRRAHCPRSRNGLKALTNLIHITESLVLDLNPGRVYSHSSHDTNCLHTFKIKVCIK